MFCRVNSVGLLGLEPFPIAAEVDLSRAIPSFDIVGLPDAAVRESRDRVRAAMKNCGFPFPERKVTVNLAPADTKKAGAALDLAICLGILRADGKIDGDFSGMAFVGELSLNGEIRPVRGILPMVLGAKKLGFSSVFIPMSNAAEGACVQGISVYPVSHLSQLLEHLDGRTLLPTAQSIPCEQLPADPFLPDFGEVKGQQAAKRALEVAAAGGHNLATMCYIIMALENQYLYDFLRFHSLYTHLFSEYFLLNIPKSILFLKAKRKADLTQPSFLFCLFQSLFYFCDL